MLTIKTINIILIGYDACRAPEVMRRPCNPEWKMQYADLVEYRDRIFKEHFPSTS